MDFNPEARSAAAKKLWSDPEYKAKMSAAIKARWADPAYKEKMRAIRSVTSKKMWANPETRAIICASLKKSGKTDEAKKNRSEAAIKRYKDPAKRAAMSSNHFNHEINEELVEITGKSYSWVTGRLRFVRKTYGLSSSALLEMYKKQGNTCGVCLGPPQKRGLVVDHDHKTMKVRGLVCSNCNVCIGFAKDSPENLEKLAAYLRTHL